MFSEKGLGIVKEFHKPLFQNERMTHSIIVTILHGRIVLVQQKAQAHLSGRGVDERLLNRDEILARLGHLGSLTMQLSLMYKVIDPLTASSRMSLGLSHFIVVMGKLEVDSTGMNVHAAIIALWMDSL